MNAHNQPPQIDPWASGVRAADVPIASPGPPPDANAPMVEFALDYAQRGWPVFPCKQSNKAPHVSDGLNAATTDPTIIRGWWQRWPCAMIGVPMGSRSGVWAVDPDPPKTSEEPDGRAIWAELSQKYGAVPATHTETTPRGGTHILFNWDPARPVTNSPGALKGKNIDVRGEGGYVIMAPSVSTGDGRKNIAGQYRVAEPLDFFQFAAAPDWVYGLVLQPEGQSAATPVAGPAKVSLFPKTSNQFWRDVNSLALDKLSSWVLYIFPRARFEKGTRAYRVSSRDLGRTHEEDLSLSPKGITDWGVWDMGDPRRGARTAIDIVVEYSGKCDATGAALWLCEKCGVDPAALGWRDGNKVNEVSGVIAEVADIDNGTVTQDGIARVFARRHQDRLRFCHDTGAWFEWTGTHWQKDKTAIAFQFCRELAREYTEDAKAAELKEVRKVSFAGGVEKFVRSDRLMAVTSEAWDRDPLLLGTPGGTVDLRTGELREPDPTDGITKVTAIAPAERADCPRWLQFLEETFSDADLIRFLQQWGGYSLTGETREHALLFGFGNGKNGKSVWLNTHTRILNDYAATSAMETFTASKNDRHSTELAMLRGARLVTASETEEGRAWAEARIKQMTGGDPITARFMHKDNFTFRPTFKLTIIGNHKPILRNVDEAARRRFNLVPFNRTPANPDPLLEQTLKKEWPGILRWLIQGCLDWQANSLIQPACVIETTRSYFEDQDLLSQWIAEECDAEPGNQYKWSPTAALFASWTEFATRTGVPAGHINSFSSKLEKLGYERGKVGGARCFRGIMTPKRARTDAD